MTDTTEVRYEDDDEYAAMATQAAAEDKEKEERRAANGYVYLDQGSYVLRMHKDVHARPLRIVRKAWIHKHGKSIYLCRGENCEHCNQAKRLEDIKHDDAWKYGAQEVYIFRATVASSTANSDYIKEDPDLVQTFVANRFAFIEGWNEFIKDLKPADFRSMMEEENAHWLTMDYYKEERKPWRCTFSLSQRRGPKAKMADDITPLDEIYVGLKQFTPQDVLHEVGKEISSIIARSGTASTPSSTSHQSIPRSNKATDVLGGDRDESSTSTSSPNSTSASDPPFDTEASKDTKSTSIKSTTSEGMTCPSSDPALGFGKYPKDVHPDCNACRVEADCMRASRSKAAN